MKKYTIDIILNAIGLLVITVFFLPLFWPTLSLFITSEIGVSDIWQFNIPIKFLMYQSLHAGTIPLWTKMIGTGFPIFAETQMGFFNITNLIMYRLFPYMIAYNLEYILIYFLTFCGMYLLFKYLKLSPLASFMGGFVFTFSGFFITHISHQNMIQTASFMPWMLLMYLLFLNEKKVLYALIALLLISQQILSGYFQISLITWIVVFCFIFFDNVGSSTVRVLLKKLAPLFVLVGLGLILSAVQILPTAELISHTLRAHGLTIKENTYFSYPIKHLITFLDPFWLGSPKNGTYPHFNQFDGSIFWENTGYIGIIPLLLILIALFIIKKKKTIAVFLGIAMVSFFLMTGSHSPFYFIHTIPPFNRFRIPSRYLLGFLFGLSGMAAFGFDFAVEKLVKIKTRPIFGAVILISSILNIFIVWNKYQPITPVASWFKDPEIATVIKAHDNTSRVYSLDDGTIWRKYFLKYGWKNKNDYYYFRNALSADYNIIPNVAQFNAYVGYVDTRRELAYGQLILDQIIARDDGTYAIATAAANLLGASNVRYIVSPGILKGDSVAQVYKVKDMPKAIPPYIVNENKSVLPRARIIYDYVVGHTLDEIQIMLATNQIDVKKTAVLEQTIPQQFSKKCAIKDDTCTHKVIWLTDSNMDVKLKVTSDGTGLLILADSYYPDWHAYIDGKETKIYPANLNSRAVVIPQGTHVVQYEYKPARFYKGATISAISYMITICLMVFVTFSSSLDTFFHTFLRRLRL